MEKQDARAVYADIIDLPHHQSETRPHMSLYDRAAQFAPFAALSGYDDMVVETARLTDSEIELSDSEIELINGVIAEIHRLTESGAHPAVSLTYFIPDQYKQGGSYEPFNGIIKKIDPVGKKLIFYGSDDIDDRRIPTVDIMIERIIRITLSDTHAETVSD